MAFEGLQLMLCLDNHESDSHNQTPTERRSVLAETPLKSALVILLVMMISQEVAIS